MPFVPYTQVSRTVARELEVFDESFRGALACAEPDDLWTAKFGFVLQAAILKATFPIPLDAAGYKEFKGDMKFRSLYERVISVYNDKHWQDGIEELADTITSDKFLGWGEQPGNMAREWNRLANTLVAVSVLEANPNLELYRDPDTLTLTSRALFADDHPCNILLSGMGTFDNNRGTTAADILNGNFFNDVKAYARSIKGANGQPMGFRGDGMTILCNGTREQLLDEATKLDTVIRGVSNAGVISPPGTPGTVVAGVTQQNRHKGTAYQVLDELTSASDNVLYVILGGGPVENVPWVVMQESAPRVIIQDESSHKFSQNLKVSYSSDGKAKAAPLLPHRIVKYTIS